MARASVAPSCRYVGTIMGTCVFSAQSAASAPLTGFHFPIHPFLVVFSYATCRRFIPVSCRVLPFPFYSFYYFILYCTAGIPPFYSLFRFSITYRALVYYSNTPLLTVYKTTKVGYVGRTTLTEVLSSGLSSSDFVYASSTLSCAVTADSPSQYRHTTCRRAATSCHQIN